MIFDFYDEEFLNRLSLEVRIFMLKIFIKEIRSVVQSDSEHKPKKFSIKSQNHCLKQPKKNLKYPTSIM